MVNWIMVAMSGFLLWFSVPAALFPYKRYDEWRSKGTNGVLHIPATAREWRSKHRLHHQYRAALDGSPVLVNFDFALPLNSEVSVIYDLASLTTYTNRNSEFGSFDDLILGSLSWDNERLRIANHDENAYYARYVAGFAIIIGLGFGWSGIRQFRKK